MNRSEYIQKLKESAPYTDEPVSFESKWLVDEERAAAIRSYFKENAGLDLYAISVSDKTIWEKTIQIARFVADSIPHDNQKEWINEKNAITLWEYSRRVPTGFNCRRHSILLSELLLSIGIKNRFITCIPWDKDDYDCHVINLVWLPELEKWAMIDSDIKEFVTDDDGIPLSLVEMREAIVSGSELNIVALDDSEVDSGLLAEINTYWAKNLYWFSAHSTYAFDLEGKRTVPDSYVSLVPPGFDCSHIYKKEGKTVVTHNADAFWNM